MDLTQLANIGEFVGGIAVLVTLVYLALQTRHTRQATQETAKFTTIQGTYDSGAAYGRWREMVASNSELSELITKTNRDQDLLEAERLRLSLVLEQLFVTAYVGHTSSRAAGTAYGASADVYYVVRFLREHEGCLPIWHQWRQFFMDISPEFAGRVDEGLAASGGSGERTEPSQG